MKITSIKKYKKVLGADFDKYKVNYTYEDNSTLLLDRCKLSMNDFIIQGSDFDSIVFSNEDKSKLISIEVSNSNEEIVLYQTREQIVFIDPLTGIKNKLSTDFYFNELKGQSDEN